MVKRNENGGKLKLSYSLYHIGRCSLKQWENKFLQELSLECHNRIIQNLPHMALVKRRTKLKLTEDYVRFRNEKISMQDIGYCKQYGCSVLFIVKHKPTNYEAVCIMCAGLNQANSIFNALSSGYKQANHPTFHSSDPWADTTDGDFFDDSLQDTTYYNNIKMYSSMADLEAVSEKDILDGLNITPYQNICFSMEDIFLAQKKINSSKAEQDPSISRETVSRCSNGNSSVSRTEEGSQKRCLPTNIVKPILRQSYEMIDLDSQPLKAATDKTFAYRVSKI